MDNKTIPFGKMTMLCENEFREDPAWTQLSKFVSEQRYSNVIVLLDENTRKHCFNLFNDQVDFRPNMVLQVASGEISKSLEVCTSLWTQMDKVHIDRNACIINLGGGVVCDLGGFVASVYKRGIDFIHVPTSLLAQVDAAIGGKTGVNFGPGKNNIGTMMPPAALCIHHKFLETLSDAELYSGFAEMLKHSMIGSLSDFEEILSINSVRTEVSPLMIQRSANIKKSYVSEDPKEQNKRKALNFGHTLGHAFEVESHEKGNPLKHGDAVALGIIAALKLSKNHVGLDTSIVDRMTKKIWSLFPHLTKWEFETARILDLIKHDKKSRKGIPQFVLLERIGHPVYDVVLTEKEVVDVL